MPQVAGARVDLAERKLDEISREVRRDVFVRAQQIIGDLIAVDLAEQPFAALARRLVRVRTIRRAPF